MFANPIWSLLLLAVPIAIYFLVIRPRLKARFTETYDHIDQWWARWWARIVAFRTQFVVFAGVVLTAAPDLLVAIAPVDFSTILPQPWAGYTGIATSLAVALMKAFETKPDGQRA